MAQKLIQSEELKQTQTQRLTQQQMLAVRLLEMPLTELEQSVTAEIDDNPALESMPPEDDDRADEISPEDDGYDTGNDDDGDAGFDTETEREERETALDEALANIGRDDEMPAATLAETTERGSADYEETTYGDHISFYDKLREQIIDVELTPREKDIMEYLIGSLDSDGLLRKDCGTIADELAVYHNIYVDETEVSRILEMLQTFDPAGIGARNLKECLLLQIRRREPSTMRRMMERVITECYEEFMNKRWNKITQTLKTDADTADKIHAELLKLNPKPGSALGETEGINLQQITPDFIVDTADDGTVTFAINGGRIPELYVSPAFADMLSEYRKGKIKANRQTKEALLYAKEKVERAKGFIDAVKQRRHTLFVTMKAIVEIQHTYFQDGNEADLKPMILKDVAEKTGLDISTVSRVSNMKYARTRWGTFLLRHFFSDSLKTREGEEMSTRKVKAALRDMIDGEDKSKPLSDDTLKDKMRETGYPVARRTIAKYREQMGIPVARLRKR